MALISRYMEEAISSLKYSSTRGSSAGSSWSVPWIALTNSRILRLSSPGCGLIASSASSQDTGACSSLVVAIFNPLSNVDGQFPLEREFYQMFFSRAYRFYQRSRTPSTDCHPPQTSRATSATSSSLRHWSSSVSRLPAAVDAKPHCGLRASRSTGTYPLASSIRSSR